MAGILTYDCASEVLYVESGTHIPDSREFIALRYGSVALKTSHGVQRSPVDHDDRAHDHTTTASVGVIDRRSWKLGSLICFRLGASLLSLTIDKICLPLPVPSP